MNEELKTEFLRLDPRAWSYPSGPGLAKWRQKVLGLFLGRPVPLKEAGSNRYVAILRKIFNVPEDLCQASAESVLIDKIKEVMKD